MAHAVTSIPAADEHGSTRMERLANKHSADRSSSTGPKLKGYRRFHQPVACISPHPLYNRDVYKRQGIDRHIRFRHRIRRAAWSSQEAQWTIDAVRSFPDGREEPVALTCNFLFSCAGYYRYSAGYTPEFPDIGRFQGRVVHPQDVYKRQAHPRCRARDPRRGSLCPAACRDRAGGKPF